MRDFMTEVARDWGRSAPWALVLISSITLDILMGVVAGGRQNRLDSTVSRKGVARKLFMVGSVVVAAIADGILPPLTFTIPKLDWTITATFAILASGWWLITEATSLTEKAGMLGLPIPARWRKALVKLQDALGGDDDPEDGGPKP